MMLMVCCVFFAASFPTTIENVVLPNLNTT